jgi:nitrite reductase/ring-hydroxylating ferredoxin subunit
MTSVVYDASKTLAKPPYFQFTLTHSAAGVNAAGPPSEFPRVRAAMPVKIDLCNAADVAAGAALKVELEKEGLTLAVFNVDGAFYVLDDTCTHGPGSLSEGFIDGDVVECNFHNGQFNIRTGEVVLPPCMVPAKTYVARVEDGKVVIEV